MARSPSRLARARRPLDLHDDVRPRRDAGRAHRESGARCGNCRTRPAASRRSSAGRFSPSTRPWPTCPPAGSFEYLRTQAIARLYLDNIPNIQSSWVTQGLKIGQLALFFGANDMGSLMIEENVVASAGTVHYLTLEQIKDAIREAGYRAAAAQRLLSITRPRPRTDLRRRSQSCAVPRDPRPAKIVGC